MKSIFRRPARWLTERGLRRAMALALAFALGSTLPAFGQAGTGQLAVRSDGYIFWIQNGERHVVYPAELSDEQINALPETIPLNAALQPILEGAAAAAVPPDGTSRAARLPLGQTCGCPIVRGTGEQSNFLITVTGVQRDAWASLRSVSPANQPPRQGFEYVMVNLEIRYASGPGDLPASLDRFDFSVLDSQNTLYSPAFVVEPQPLVGQTVFPGAVVNGSITFQVPRDDPEPVLVWRYNFENARWLALG